MRVYRLHERSHHSDDAAGLGQCGSARFATPSCFAHTETETFFSVCARRPRFVPEPDKVALLVGALSVAGAIFLMLELSEPYRGLMRISDEPLRNAMAQINR